MRELKLFSVLMVVGMALSAFTLRSAYGIALYPALVVFCGLGFVFSLEALVAAARRFGLWPRCFAERFPIESIWCVPAWKASLFTFALFGLAFLIGRFYA